MLMASEIPGMGRRLAAMVIDLAVLKLLEAPIAKAVRTVSPEPVALVVMEYVVVLAYAAILLRRRGQTVGKMLTKLRVVSTLEGGLGIGQILGRSIAKWTPIFAFLAMLAVSMPAPPNVFGESADVSLQQLPPEEAGGISDLAVWLSYVGLLLGLGLFLVAKRHPDRLAVHDRIARTAVIRTS